MSDYPLNKLSPFEYYKNQLIYYRMPALEEIKNKMFHEIYPDLEKEIWLAIDTKNTRKLVSIYTKLTKEIDELRMDQHIQS